MSKKHFIALADALRPVYRSGQLSEAALDAICAFNHSMNHNFMEDRFRSYLMGECGPNGGAIKK